MLAIAVATAEPAKLAEVSWEPAGVALLLLSCLMGVAISFTGFVARREVTATCFTVVGVLNKILTVLGSVLFSGQHASGIGILSLIVCVTAAACYRQAPQRRTMAARAAVGGGDHAALPSTEPLREKEEGIDSAVKGFVNPPPDELPLRGDD